MKKLMFFSLVAASLLTVNVNAQADKSKRPSPPATATATTVSGTTITINYSQPSVKGRTFGQDIAPYGKVWRTGANEATTFEINKAATISGKQLPAGKYSIYSIPGEKEWTIIFNKKAEQWGTNYTEADDALRVTVPADKTGSFVEKMTIDVNKEGVVNISWGNAMAKFIVQ